MKKQCKRLSALLLVFLLLLSIYKPAAYASEDPEVIAVIEQLEAIDTLQEIQDARSQYTTNGHYDINTTDNAIIEAHNTKRNAYEAYVSNMFAARIAAQQAYDALTDAQKSQIDPALTAKLSNDLPNKYLGGTYEVTPRNDAYSFEAVQGPTGFVYEVGNHMVSGQIPQTFILVDTSNGETSWTPNGLYQYGTSNYDVTYCCDVNTGLDWGTDYKRMNLEDSDYYNSAIAAKIRAIVLNSYPFISMEEMKANLKNAGLDSDYVDSLTRADLISAVQMAIWSYANVNDLVESSHGYFATINVPKNTGIYFTPLHDYTNECWDWLPKKQQRTYDERAAYRVNNLVWYLCNLEGIEANSDEKIISDVEITRAEVMTTGTEDLYNVGMYIHLAGEVDTADDLTVTVTSYSENTDSTRNVTDRVAYSLTDSSILSLNITAYINDTIEVVVNGTQNVGKGVYFYEAEGGRDVSQSLVGVASGATNVYVHKTFTFENNLDEMGLRIYKTAADTGLPIEDITFHIYEVILNEGETLGEKPTAAEIEKYAVDANKIISITTDVTGYAEADLEEGTYLIVEEHNAEKVVAPVEPFYIQLPMPVEVELEVDGETQTTIEYKNIVSVYPKNEPTSPPPPPVPPIPPPNDIYGRFEIIKHEAGDTSLGLQGAEFQVYRAATSSDPASELVILTIDGVEIAVVPVMDGEKPLVLVSGENGYAVSPELSCGMYYIVETKAPSGYNLLDEPVSILVQSNTSTTIEPYYIPNTRGPILPETGGAGTKWFIYGGGIIALGAGILLITKRRMQNYN